MLVGVAVVAGALVFVGGGGDERASAAGGGACGRVLGSPDQRLLRCLDAAGTVSLPSDAREDLAEVADGGRVLVAAAGADVDSALLLEESRPLRRRLSSDEEGSVAESLLQEDVRAVIVHRALTNALDRDATVMSRLAHHDFLEWFQLRWVTEDAFVYAVRAGTLRLRDETGDLILRGLRARLAGSAVPAQTWDPEGVRMIGAVRLRGKTLVMRHVASDALEPALDELANKIRRRWERQVETIGVGSIDDNLDELRLDVHVVRERAPVVPRSEDELFELWELGIDGAMMTATTGSEERFAFLPGSEATTRALLDSESFLQAMADDAQWRGLRPWERRKVKLTVFRAEHFMEGAPGGGSAVRLLRGNPVVEAEALTDDAIRQMLVAGGDWWLRNQFPDGSFVYKYWPDDNRRSADYNEVRHILAARDLVDTWRYRPDPRYIEGARRAMDWLLQYEVTADGPEDRLLPEPAPGMTLFRYPLTNVGGSLPNQKLGTVAVALLGWLNWAEATGSKVEDERIRAMARYTLSRLADNGKFQPYDVPAGHPYHGQVNDIVPGEAALALGRVAEYFDDDTWLDFFPKYLDYYEPWFRERVAKKQTFGRWPATTYPNEVRLELVQFGPWTVMACRQYYERTGDERAAKFGLEIADWLIDNYQWSSGRSPWPDYVGGYYKVPWELPAMQAFVYSEATAAAYALAGAFQPERAAKFERSTRETLRFLRVMQYDDVSSYLAPRPGDVLGAVRYTLNETKIRIDYLGHAMSTLSQYLDTRTTAQPSS